EELLDGGQPAGRQHLADVIVRVRGEAHARESSCPRSPYESSAGHVLQAVLADQGEIVALVEDLAGHVWIDLPEPADLAVLLRDELLIERRDLDVEVVRR